jgi:hypothetical protein
MQRMSEAKLSKTAAKALLRNIMAEAAPKFTSGIVEFVYGGEAGTPRYVLERLGASIRGVINCRDGVVVAHYELPTED